MSNHRMIPNAEKVKWLTIFADEVAHEKLKSRILETVGIILNYFYEDYDFYRNLRGDYSDVQVCVDIKFDGVVYRGEFHHKHINPIYAERMKRWNILRMAKFGIGGAIVCRRKSKIW